MEELFNKTGFVIQGIRHVSADDACKLSEAGAILLDVREEYLNAFKKFDVRNTLQVPLSILENDISMLSPDNWHICADSAGIHSREACLLLAGKGFTRIANLAGGIIEWERDGFPVITDKKERLTGSCVCQLKRRERK